MQFMRAFRCKGLQRLFCCVVLARTVAVSLAQPAEETCPGNTMDENNGEQCAWSSSVSNAVPIQCSLVMAPSTIQYGGWGVFTLRDRPRGRPLWYGDVVVQLTDLNSHHSWALQRLLKEYLWSAEETGGFYEGRNVISSLPGIGMLANGLSSKQHNVLPFVPSYDEGGLTRSASPGAGAISHYHNYTFFLTKDLAAGDEVFVNYGENWFKERKMESNLPQTRSKSLDALRDEGFCLDNLRPGVSTIPNAGRGAFATRAIPSGSLVLPVPVITISDRRALDITRQRQDGSFTENLKQLLLNYCFGHNESSVLLYPYGPMAHLVNHGSGKTANVKLEWSSPPNISLHDLKQDQPSFLMRLTALRDIPPGDEILLDYQSQWMNAWTQHTQHWKPDNSKYIPSYVVEDVTKTLRTNEELQTHPYPDNVFTSCFYRYSDNANVPHKTSAAKGAVTTFRWKQTRGVFELQNMRPCEVLKREQDPKMGTVFTVQIRNRFGLPAQERIPKGAVHIVTHVPRSAIRFSDKLYTTDMHLESAFRQEIGLSDNIFSEEWKDLK